MRRLVALFLLCLLPVQIGWASVADSCGHEPSDAAHFAHHNDPHYKESGAASADQSGGGSDIELLHDHCHLASFIGLLPELVVTTPIVVTVSVLDAENPVYSSQVLERLERPKWHSLA